MKRQLSGHTSKTQWAQSDSTVYGLMAHSSVTRPKLMSNNKNIDSETDAGLI